jgi:phospholipase/carboxylesterase
MLMADDLHRLAPAGASPARRLVVLVHGYASSGVEMMPLAEEWTRVLPDAAFFAPDGPLDAEGEAGLAWAPRRSPRDGRLAGEVIEASRGLSDHCDAELRRLGLGDEALALVGFSQGALLALHAGLRRATAPAAVLCYGGGLVGRAALEAEIRARPPVLLVNGTVDQLAPADGLRPAVTFLEDLGVVAEGVALPGLGHEIDARAILLGGRFLASAFAYRDRQP